MTEPTWKTHTPQYDGHAPDDWDGGYREYFNSIDGWLPVAIKNDKWFKIKYRYRPLQNATHEPNNAAYGKMMADLTEQCLRLPQADRDALIEALQKPQRDWADDLAKEVRSLLINCAKVDQVAKVIRSKCQPKSIGEKLREALQNEPI